MKKIFALSFVALSLLFSSCKKDSIVPSPELKATIGTTAWVATTRVTNVSSSNIITITGKSDDGKSIIITINGVTAKTYTLTTPTVLECASNYSTSLTDINLATTGKVVLTQMNTTLKRISGTFTFTFGLTSPIVITGSFKDLTYI